MLIDLIAVLSSRVRSIGRPCPRYFLTRGLCEWRLFVNDAFSP